jgi:hypothetical protein
MEPQQVWHLLLARHKHPGTRDHGFNLIPPFYSQLSLYVPWPWSNLRIDPSMTAMSSVSSARPAGQDKPKSKNKRRGKISKKSRFIWWYILAMTLKGYLGNWPHYYRVVRSKLVFYNVLTTSINNIHILQTLSVIYAIYWALRHSDTVIGEWIVPTRPSPFSNCMSRIPHALPRQRNAAPFSISALGSVYDVAQTNLWRCEPNFSSVVHVVKYETACRRDWCNHVMYVR